MLYCYYVYLVHYVFLSPYANLIYFGAFLHWIYFHVWNVYLILLCKEEKVTGSLACTPFYSARP